MRKDGSTFDDYAVHRLLKRHGVKRPDGEWFRCGVDVVRAAIAAVRNRTDYAVARTRDFGMRPEQAEAVRQTAAYFRRKAKEEPGTKPRFLWNAKMRFGKTFAAYELAKEMGFRIMQFNAVVQENASAIHLYEKEGFKRLGMIPGGFRAKDGEYHTIILFYHEL